MADGTSDYAEAYSDEQTPTIPRTPPAGSLASPNREVPSSSAPQSFQSGRKTSRTSERQRFVFDSGFSSSTSTFDHEQSNREYGELDITSSVTPGQLRSRCFQKDEDGNTYLHLMVIFESNAGVICAINKADDIEQINDFNNLSQTPLLLAVLARNPHITRLLVVAGADRTKADRDGNTPLHIACELKEKEIIKMLVDEPRNEEIERLFPHLNYMLPRSTCRGAIDMMNSGGYYPIHTACYADFEAGIRILIEGGAKICAQSRHLGKTVLHFAVEQLKAPMVQFLIEQCQSAINGTTYNGQTPLDIANSNVEIREYLVSKGATHSQGYQELQSGPSRLPEEALDEIDSANHAVQSEQTLASTGDQEKVAGVARDVPGFCCYWRDPGVNLSREAIR